LKETSDTFRPARTEEEPDTAAGNPPGSTEQAADANNDDLEFVITEAHDQETELVGGFKTSSPSDLGIESPADLLRPEVIEDKIDHDSMSNVDHLPIGDTHPPPPSDHARKMDDPGILELSPDTMQSPSSECTLEKLSDERLQEISRNMRVDSGEPEYLTAEEKQRLITSIDETPVSEAEPSVGESKPATGFDNQPIVPPKKKSHPKPTATELELAGGKPKMSRRLRGVAFYVKGYIQIVGEQELHEGDELTVNGREYILRRKKFNRKLLIGIFGPLVALAIFALGARLSSDADTGTGRIVGLALDENDQPYLSGASIYFPELSRTYETNSQGFFKSEPLDAGSYKIELLIDGDVLATDYATVANNYITTLALRPDQAETPPPGWSRAASSPPRIIEAPPPPKQAATPSPAKPKASSNKTGGKKTAAKPKWSKLALVANVEGAKLSVDGSVLGAGNLTYPRLKPGKHSYTVSKDGYQPVQGTFDLIAGKTKALNVTLVAATVEQKAESYLERDYYASAVNALEQGEITTAITDLTEAIKLNPSYADAYSKRAEAHLRNNDSRAAHDDYVRAAEILQFHKDYKRANTAYDRAISLNSKSIQALLGRGNLYLTRGEEIAAIADFDMVVRLDKRNLQGYLGLGQARYDQGYFKKAVKHFKDARSIDSKSPMIHKYLMMSYFGAGDFKQVRKSYDKFLKYASEAEIEEMRADSRFGPILRVAED